MSDQIKTIGIFGATGLIGGALGERLSKRDWRVIRFSRNPPADQPGWRVVREVPDLEGLDAVVNLAGESIAQRWTSATWKRIYESRVGLTRSIVGAMREMDPEARPAALLNASAVGIYPPSGDQNLTEREPAGEERMAELCRDWEAAAVEAEEIGVRVVRLRTGIVLGEGGEAWERLRTVFKWGLGGRLGSGRQWMPWIHLADEVRAIEFALESESLAGPLNLSAPEPETNREFTRKLGAALHRPAFFVVPGFALRLGLGGFAESLLGSYRMVPARLEELGFEFRFSKLERALEELTAKR